MGKKKVSYIHSIESTDDERTNEQTTTLEFKMAEKERSYDTKIRFLIYFFMVSIVMFNY